MKSISEPPRRGRPRQFDADKALDQALEVFWRKGYEGTALPDLTRAMKINRPSLYAAFGNKEELFKQVLDRYAKKTACYIAEALELPTARKVAEHVLESAVEMMTRPSFPRGCLLVHGALSCSESSRQMGEELATRRKTAETLLRKRFERAKTDGDLPTSARPAELAKYLATILHGLSVQSSAGATRAELKQVARLALSIWPE